ncbi:MAG: hypothetical protein U9M90_00720 [Patescibacteria group bacterium]|nr:hypothetical protein [Patescibacteria group bacterium]
MEVCKDPKRMIKADWVSELYENLTGEEIINAVREDVKRMIDRSTKKST